MKLNLKFETIIWYFEGFHYLNYLVLVVPKVYSMFQDFTCIQIGVSLPRENSDYRYLPGFQIPNFNFWASLPKLLSFSCSKYCSMFHISWFLFRIMFLDPWWVLGLRFGQDWFDILRFPILWAAIFQFLSQRLLVAYWATAAYLQVQTCNSSSSSNMQKSKTMDCQFFIKTPWIFFK